MAWVVLVLVGLFVALGVVIYRIDKKVKAKYEKSFNPSEWQLPGHIELRSPIEARQKIPLQPRLQSIPLPSAASEKETYQRTPSVYSEAHLVFYKALSSALAGEFHLLTNINAVNVLASPVTVNNLPAKPFDFVVCDKAQLTALCIIDFGNRVDAQLKSACETAQLPLVSFNIATEYDSQRLRTEILSAIGLAPSHEGAATESVLDIADESPTNNLKENDIELVLCQECSAVMLKRRAKNGANAGKLFWLCSTYPACRGMRSVK